MHRGAETPKAFKSSFDISRTNVEERDEVATPIAEKAFADLLAANEQISEVIKIHDEMERMARNEQELDFVRERSKVELKGNQQVSFSPVNPQAIPGRLTRIAFRINYTRINRERPDPLAMLQRSRLELLRPAFSVRRLASGVIQ